MKKIYYVTRSSSDELYELRQSRFKNNRAMRGGEGHPRDVCAVGTREQLTRIIEQYYNVDDVEDWSDL